MSVAFLNLGYQEIFLILIVAVLLFGGRLPEVARNVGKWFFDIKRGVNELNRDLYAPPPPDATPLPKRPSGEAIPAPPNDIFTGTQTSNDDEAAGPPEDDPQKNASFGEEETGP